MFSLQVLLNLCHDCNLYFLDYTCCPLTGSRWPRSWRQRWERWEIEAWRLLSWAANGRFLWNFGFVGRLFDWNQNLRNIQIERQMSLLFAPWQPCILCVCVRVSKCHCYTVDCRLGRARTLQLREGSHLPTSHARSRLDQRWTARLQVFAVWIPFPIASFMPGWADIFGWAKDK